MWKVLIIALSPTSKSYPYVQLKITSNPNWLLFLELYAKINQLGSRNKYINSNIKLKFYKTNMNSNNKLQINYITYNKETQKRKKEKKRNYGS